VELINLNVSSVGTKNKNVGSILKPA